MASEPNSVEYRNACRRCVRELRNKINSQLDFRRWALRHHPDKGGDVEVFQRTSECVDMVYRDGCLDQIREWDRGRRSVNDWARTEAIVASVVQSASACDIESVGIELAPWIGRWKGFKRRTSSQQQQQQQQHQQHLRGISLTIGHKRILGIPLRLYRNVEAKLHLDRHHNKPVLLSVGPNWTIPKTKGRLDLNVSSSSKCNTIRPFLQPETLDILTRLKVGAVALEAGCLLDHSNVFRRYGSREEDASISRRMRPVGFTLGVKVDIIHFSSKHGLSLAGMGRRKGKGQTTQEQNHTEAETMVMQENGVAEGQTTAPVEKESDSVFPAPPEDQ